MVLAQAKEIADAATKELARAAGFGFEAYLLILVILIVVLCLGVHFWFLVLPDRKQRRESAINQEKCLETFATNYAIQTRLLTDLDARLSTMGKDIAAAKCPLKTGEAAVAQKVLPTFTLQPMGGA